MLKTMKSLGVYDVTPFWSNESLRVAIFPCSTIYCELGRIKKKNDGRWEWFLKLPSTHFYTENWPDENCKKQGVCRTREDAEIAIERIWKLHEYQ